MPKRAQVLTALLLLGAGCYRHHLREEIVDAGTDATGWDGGTGARDARTIDGCTPPIVDPGTPPAEPEVPHGARPSELPSAADWLDPPEPHEGPCCDVDEVDETACLPRARANGDAVWNGVEWAAFLVDRSDPSRFDYDIVRFDAALRPLSRIDFAYEESTAWFAGGAGSLVLRSIWSHLEWDPHALRLDRTGVIASETPIPIGATRATRVVSQHGWAILGDERARIDRRAIVVLYDDLLGEIARVDFGAAGAAGSNVHVVDVGGRLVTLEGDESAGTMDVRAFEGPGLREVEHSTWAALRTPLLAHGAFAFRDDVVLVIAGTGPRTWLAARDAFSGITTLEPTLVVPSDGEVAERGSEIAADSVGGTIAICSTSYGREGRPTRVDLVLLDGLGRLLGDPVELARGVGIRTCHVARAATDTFVAFWQLDMEGAIDGATLTVRRP